MSLHAEVKKLYDSYLNKISEHQTFDKTTKGLYKHALQIKAKISENDSELVNLTNEIARVRIDQLNTKAEIERLEKKQKEVQKEQQEKKDTVKTYEVEIRQGFDINTQKQLQVAQLNKDRDTLEKKSQQVHGSSLATKIESYVKEIQQWEEKIGQIKHMWIKQ